MARKNFIPNRYCEHCGTHYWCEPTRLDTARFCSMACLRAHAIADVPNRFWLNVDRSGGPDACWPWMGADHRGYGVITIRTEAGRETIRTHRLALKLSGVDVPNGEPVCHTCDNPPCCNPAHLYVGTSLSNTHDAMDRGRFKSCLTEEIVRDARRRYRPYKVSYQKLADEYGCSLITIRDAVVGRTWAHVVDVPPVTEPAYRLDDEAAATIRRRWEAGGITQTQLANEYGVDLSTVHLVVKGRTWVDKGEAA